MLSKDSCRLTTMTLKKPGRGVNNGHAGRLLLGCRRRVGRWKCGWLPVRKQRLDIPFADAQEQTRTGMKTGGNL